MLVLCRRQSGHGFVPNVLTVQCEARLEHIQSLPDQKGYNEEQQVVQYIVVLSTTGWTSTIKI